LGGVILEGKKKHRLNIGGAIKFDRQVKITGSTCFVQGITIQSTVVETTELENRDCKHNIVIKAN
jgi:hypothetical protein